MDPASASTRVIRSLAGKADDVIRAYHGSPYSFDRFDASKIGTGSGAQKYGYGLYFAGSEPTATTYKSGVSALRRTPQEDALEFWRRAAEISGNKQKAVLDALDRAEVRLEEAAGMPEAEQRWKDIIRHLYELDYRQPLPRPPGHMYEVEIGYPEEALLDYDSPFSTPAGAAAARAMRKVLPHSVSPQTLRELESGEWRFISHAGENPYIDVAHKLQGMGRAEHGAQLLREAGIPGIRYLDQGSRSAVAGTRNYVMFPGTEDRIKILRQYGLLPPLMAPALMEDE